MGTAVATTFPDDITAIGDKIANLTLKQAVELQAYLKDAHGIEPAAGEVIVTGEKKEEKIEEKTTFDVILTDVGDKKINVIKEVRGLTGLGLAESKTFVESVPKAIKENATKEEAEKIKQTIEAAGGKVELK